jgi:hypothetical protein
MSHQASGLRWGIEQRLEFIEFRLFWDGGINRSNIKDFFGVSVPQASKDLSHYQEIAPENMRYDRSLKRYFASDRFKPRFLQPDAIRYLTQLNSIAHGALTASETWLSEVPDFAAVPLPRRNIDPAILRRVLSCVREGRALEIRYQSLSTVRPKPQWRWITPHAFGFDGMRWHARAFCHIDLQFKDFLLPRILDAKEDGSPGAKPTDDYTWIETTEVVLKPHPALTEDQQKVVTSDFGMKKGMLHVRVKLAMLYYFLKRLRLDFEEHKQDPQQQHVVLADPDSVRASLARAQYKAESVSIQT